MKILVMGAGKMGSFFIDLLSFDHEVAVFERDPKRMRFTYNCQRFTSYEEIQAFRPELLINAVTLKYTTLSPQGVYHQRHRQCEDRFERVLRADGYALCLHSPDVWSNLR